MLAGIHAHRGDLGGTEAEGLQPAQSQHRIGVHAGLGVVLTAVEDLQVQLLLGVIGVEVLVRAEVVDEGVAVQHAGIAHVLRLGQRPHVVAALEEEARGDDRVGGVGVDRLVVDADVDDVVVHLAGAVHDVLDVVGDVEGKELTGGRTLGVALPLLLEHLLELGAGDLAGVQGVAEGHHRVGLGVGDHAVALGAGRLVPQLGADAAGVHPSDDLVLAVQAGVLEVPLHGVREHVAGGGVAGAVIALGGRLVRDRGEGLTDAVLVVLGDGGAPRGGDVVGDRADRLGAEHLGVGDRVGNDLGGGVVGGGPGAGVEVGVLGGDQLGAALDHVPVLVVPEREGHGADVGAAGAGLHDGAHLAVLAGHRGVEGVGLVGVAVEDRVDLGGRLRDDLVEDRVGVARCGARLAVPGGALVVRGDEDVVLLVGLVQLVDGVVDALDRVAEGEALDRRGADLAEGLGGDGADHGDLDVTRLDDRVGLQGVAAIGVVHVRGQVREVGARGDAIGQIVLALVELVVADRARVHAEGVEEVDGGLVPVDG
ncbi:Spidroin-1 (Dragline silk fibroin 1) (Fragment) [Corynebacterium xerosis]